MNGVVEPAAKDGGKRPLRDEMRVVAARVAPLLRDHHPLILAVAGCGEGAGASTVARELAKYFCDEGMKVLLCGSRSELSRLSADGGPAASNISEVTRSTLEGLDLYYLPEIDGAVRTVTPEEQLKDWLGKSEGLFDLVVVDVPPLTRHVSWVGLLGADTFVILLVEAEKTRVAAMREATHLLAEAEATVLGVVFNKKVEHLPAIISKYL